MTGAEQLGEKVRPWLNPPLQGAWPTTTIRAANEALDALVALASERDSLAEQGKRLREALETIAGSEPLPEGFAAVAHSALAVVSAGGADGKEPTCSD